MHRRRFLGLSSAAVAGAGLGLGTGPVGTLAQENDARPVLVVAQNFIPPSLDPSASSYELISGGQAETLTRVTDDFGIEPWLAESITQVDPTTWQIALRQNATFWDGAPVDAEAVVASLHWSWASIAGSEGFIDPETAITAVDAWMVELVTPAPDAALPNNLASLYFPIVKPGEDGSYLLTGPYIPDELNPDESFTATAFDGHWGGAPAFAALEARLVPDANTAILALQSGEVDLVSSVPVDMVDLITGEFEVASVEGSRVHHVMFNHTSPLMADPAVRTAFSLAIDRATLNELAASGHGTVTTNPFPASSSIGAQPPADPDPDGAATLLDEAGWVLGDDGVRERDGQRLELLIGSYAGRPELTPLGIGIQDQLNDLGFAIEVQEAADITEFLSGDDWDASMYSINTLSTGDALYLLNAAYVTDGIYNYGRYSNPALDELVAEIQSSSDTEERSSLIDQAVALLVG
ncbi:MAG: hypothetical protein KC438_11565, partial [Thermomicrobiales bacterium]|nr:hypothetical protein [Thermomicrobiales bacterium]